ncbi:hypothetical protein AVEN_84781-1 [Araneus ventricosus]|uniref:Uncharacterized protein n=1 Tax=Araneus ventricosus TaxID=182803 RepID=A0A4Y2U1P1_ARAVE|nr:hypothetical protein AVEN_84781-1 [Araneus ventricosus]
MQYLQGTLRQVTRGGTSSRVTEVHERLLACSVWMDEACFSDKNGPDPLVFFTNLYCCLIRLCKCFSFCRQSKASGKKSVIIFYFLVLSNHHVIITAHKNSTVSSYRQFKSIRSVFVLVKATSTKTSFRRVLQMMTKAKSLAKACKWISSGRSVFTISSAKIMSKLPRSNPCHANFNVGSHGYHIRYKIGTGASWIDEGPHYDTGNVGSCLGEDL